MRSRYSPIRKIIKFIEYKIMDYLKHISISGVWGPTANFNDDGYGG